MSYSQTIADVQRYYDLLRYELALQDAGDELLAFAMTTMPDRKNMHDPSQSMFMPARHFEIMADLMESVERGEIRKVILSLPPRHGKTELCTKRMAAWYSGRHPARDIITATYNEKFALDFGRKVRGILMSQRFKQVFPDYELNKWADEHLSNTRGGDLFFLGRRSSTTGRGGDLILVDDPTKDDKEVKYATFRDDCWSWFTQVLLTRRHTDKSALIITQTRWSEDDLVGRLTDKDNPCYAKEFADGFEVVNLPAIADSPDDPLGRKVGDALWPERFGKKYLAEMQSVNPLAFSSLYQGDPTPSEGVFFQEDEIHTYGRGELPQENLMYYAASDHAVGTNQVNDPTCMGVYAVDEKGDAYVLPDVVWRRINTMQCVEEMLRIMRTYPLHQWYAEKGHISKSIGPFLRKRMVEEEVHCPITEDHPVGDPVQRAQSARARCAQGRILFPSHATWWPRAKTEILKFPNARHDDFVCFLSIIGMKLRSLTTPSPEKKTNAPRMGTFGALKAQWAMEDRQQSGKLAHLGW